MQLQEETELCTALSRTSVSADIRRECHAARGSPLSLCGRGSSKAAHALHSVDSEGYVNLLIHERGSTEAIYALHTSERECT